MRIKKKTVEQEKNRNSQKSVKSVQLMGMRVCGGKDFWKRYPPRKNSHNGKEYFPPSKCV